MYKIWTDCLLLSGVIKVASNRRNLYYREERKNNKTFLLWAFECIWFKDPSFGRYYTFLASLYIAKYTHLNLAHSRHTINIWWLNGHIKGVLAMFILLACTNSANLICTVAKEVFSLCLSWHLDYSDVFCPHTAFTCSIHSLTGL